MVFQTLLERCIWHCWPLKFIKNVVLQNADFEGMSQEHIYGLNIRVIK